jgi:hypothetical protein
MDKLEKAGDLVSKLTVRRPYYEPAQREPRQATITLRRRDLPEE